MHSIDINISAHLSIYGIYIAIISLIVIVAYLFSKGNSQKTIVTLGTATIVVILLIFSLNVIYDVTDSNENFIESNEINLEKVKSIISQVLMNTQLKSTKMQLQ